MHRIHIQAPLVPVMNHAEIAATGIYAVWTACTLLLPMGRMCLSPIALLIFVFLMQVRIIQDYKMIHQQNYFKDVWICADVLPKNITMALYLLRMMFMNY